jgi:hypothetical protein
MQDQKTMTVTKIPLLGDIPYLGLLFQRDQVSKTKTELLIFLTPHVALAPEHLVPMAADEVKGLHLTPGAVHPGTFQEHIQGLRRRSRRWRFQNPRRTGIRGNPNRRCLKASSLE